MHVNSELLAKTQHSTLYTCGCCLSTGQHRERPGKTLSAAPDFLNCMRVHMLLQETKSKVQERHTAATQLEKCRIVLGPLLLRSDTSLGSKSSAQPLPGGRWVTLGPQGLHLLIHNVEVGTTAHQLSGPFQRQEVVTAVPVKESRRQ